MKLAAVSLLAGSVCAAAVAAAVAARPAADPRSGERAFQKCYACHSVRAGETGLGGPNLRGIVGRRVAAERGFDYSPALRALARRHPRWTARLLDRFVADPERVAPGTSMSFHGIPDARERADLVRWLRRQR